MDTRLKKMRKLSLWIILACIVLPALILTALYPQMEKAALEQKAEYEAQHEEWESQMLIEQTQNWQLEDSFDNMAMEAAYYVYGNLLREASDQNVNMIALEEYGWINDYYDIHENTDFYAELSVGEEAKGVLTDSADIDKDAEEKEKVEEIELPETEETIAEETITEEIPIREIPDDVEIVYMEQESAAAAQPGTYVTTNVDWDMAPMLDKSDEEVLDLVLERSGSGFLQMDFNSYGELSDARLCMRPDVWYDDFYYDSIRESMEQYQINANWIRDNMDAALNTMELVPKDFRILFILNESDYFVYNNGHIVNDYYINWSSLYWDIGALIPVIALAVFVALAALLLPFIRKLETGWEKVFCLPFEIIAAMVVLGAIGACGMFYVMSESTLTNLYEFIETGRTFKVIGVDLSPEFVYGVILFINFIGWAICFGAEYVAAASIRQFLCGPVRYLKERVLVVRFVRWLKRVTVRFYHYVTDININERLHGSIIKIVLVNFIILTVLCCLWFFGVVGLIIYSIALYVFLKKYGEKVQGQYQSILHGTSQIAEGDFKIEMEEELGIFAPIGVELKKVQQGFSKAVAEEAKSQSMKTELITNVSHDLKTPLTAIITYIELLKKENATEEEKKQYIATIDQKSQRLKILIDDLFEVSKATSGNIQMNFMDVDVVNLMKQVRLELEEKIAESNLTFRWNFPDEKVILSLDGQKTYRIFENLLNNALKYSMPYSRVYVDIVNLQSQVKIIFRNISSAELNADPEHLTERFVRGDDSRKTEGSGLGLAIVKSFVELQNGKLNISVDGDLFKVCILWNK